VPPYRLGRLYRDALGAANQRLASAADEVILMVFVLALSLSDMIDWARVTRVGDACRKRAMIALRRWTSKNLQT
jgi:hypothetical protein